MKKKVFNSLPDHPILNSAFMRSQDRELDDSVQPTQQMIEIHRWAEFILKPKRRQKAVKTSEMIFNEEKGLSANKQQYNLIFIINGACNNVDTRCAFPSPNQWQVSPATVQLFQHRRYHKFNDIYPFPCHAKAIATVVWYPAVVPQFKHRKGLLNHHALANTDANQDLIWLALKGANGVFKTSVMAMIIAWQKIDAMWRPRRKYFPHGFLVYTPGLTIHDSSARTAPAVLARPC